MASVPLNILPVLRPWALAGVCTLLLDEDRIKPLPPHPAPSDPLPEKGTDRGSPVAGSHMKTTHGTDSHHTRFPAPPPSSACVPDEFPSPPEDLTESGASSVLPLPVARWQPFWRDLLTRTPPHPVLLWTYPGLARDLGGKADPGHRDFLRRLLGDMALPKGSHAFWPLDSWPPATEREQTRTFSVDVPHFLGGVAALKPDTVLLLTGTPPDGLGLSDLRLLQPAMFGGRRFVLMPHVDQLVHDPRRHAKFVAFLKTLLKVRA